MGGMAELYRAKITGVEGFEKLIAIKKILPHLSNQEDLVGAFVDEAKLAAHLQHENIIQIYDFGSMEDSYFIAMEFLNGQDLQIILNSAKINQHPMSLEHTCYIVARICAGLNYAHNLKNLDGEPLNIIHRDISPQNIFISWEGQIKIIDFGIAKAAGRDNTTKAGTIKGKAAYMSPEQADGRPIDSRSDIFATGIVLYEMLTGRKMFSGDTFEVLSRVRKVEFTPAIDLIPSLPEKLYSILDKALQEQPEDRYQTCEEMQSDIEECLYSLKARPTAKGLAEYVNDLFALPEKSAEHSDIEPTIIAEHDSSGAVVAPTDKTTENQVVDRQPPGPSKIKTGFGRFGRVLIPAVMVFLCIIYYLSGSTQYETHDISTPVSPPPAETTENVNRFPIDKVELETGLVEEAIREKRFYDAISICESFMEKNPEQAQKIKPLYARALYSKAMHLADSQPGPAIELLRRSAAADPDVKQTWFKLGHLLVNVDKHKDALECFLTVIKLDPDYVRAYYNLGIVYDKLGDLGKAEQLYTRTIELNPSFVDKAYFNLALVQDKQGKRIDCIRNLELAVKANPKNLAARKTLDKKRL